ncbi:hypothetical protein A2803_02445 [Candidatus Woesebacteria bacterium RIFCSPHIGHO2_01_FULL_44_21]|uniref:Uncharacterized protein n=1 Tax=Candidatus Woesebacteria bacterium RIFCSPHIGHO2_01_FULL_44_21 TaxID=1802503 RepID=A0A1F7Z0A8_9BACT|nr:MAG: hypothetical protein A2803_02445 [Candidatus Woesebacteria bacterium RIFCSPHIGHO2_01_FULL_44_21]OGM71561.1 MAG: hypothetical protein A2897_01440 [Candidatus Woesebacteria bacterium RIFCSPLOWO2_01_FULL_44_24b]
MGEEEPTPNPKELLIKPKTVFRYTSSRDRGEQEAELVGYGLHEGSLTARYKVVGNTSESWQYVDELRKTIHTNEDERVEFIVKVKRRSGEMEDDWKYAGYIEDSNPPKVKVVKKGELGGQEGELSKEIFVSSLVKWNEPQE